MRGVVTAALVMIALIGALGLVWAQGPDPCPYEMRAYVDDASTTDSDTHQFNLSTIRATYVCPHCGYSSYYAGKCPDPYGDTSHPTNLDLVKVPPKARVLATALQSVAVGFRDYQYRPTNVPALPPPAPQALVGRAILGKVFHPFDAGAPVGFQDYRSTLHLQTCDLVSASAGATPAGSIDSDSRLRLFIMPPGVTRPCAIQTDLDNIDSQDDGDLFDADDDPTIKDAYIQIGLNPYRVDNGDEWLIRYTRTENGAGTLTDARVQACSLLYGFDMDIADDDPTDDGTNYYLTNSGAVNVQIHHLQFDGTDGTDTTWLFHFTVMSNTYLMPSSRFDELGSVGEPKQVDNDGDGFRENDADWNAATQDYNPGGDDDDELKEWAWDDTFPTLTDAKECWLELGSGSAVSGGIADDSDIAETPGDGTAEPVPYVIPPNMVGVGIAAVQYSNEGDDLSGDHDDRNDFRFYNGWEWQYDYQEDVTNDGLARKNPPAQKFESGPPNSTQRPWVQYLGECHYFSSRVELPPPTETWLHSDGSGTLPWPNADYPRIVIGEVDGSGNVAGEYGPGANTPTRYFELYNRCHHDSGSGQDDRVLRCDFCGYTFVDTTPSDPSDDLCPFHPDSNMTVLSTYYTAGVELWRKLAVSGEVESTGGTSAVRHVLPEIALKYHEDRRYVYPSEISAATAGDQAVHFEIPKYQPPSVPAVAGANYANNLSGDEGYRGGLIVHADQRNYGSGSSGLTGGWNVFYRCPDCGGLTTDPDNHPATACSGHQVCPYCGSEYPPSAAYGTQCGFCGGDLDSVTGDDTVQEHDLWCEEYDVGDIQVSVLRKPAMRATVPAVQIGRVQPGVNTYRPDTNVQNVAAGYRAFPSETSPRTGLPVLNDGNVTSPIRVANVYDPDASAREISLPHYSRIEVPAYDYSYTRIAQSTPITRLTLQSYNPGLTADAEWDITSALPFATGGTELFGRLQAGYSGYPVPLGQPAGTYLGQTLYFLDTDGDGALDFEIGGPGGTATNTFDAQFDPLADHPLEPVYDTVLGDVRVFGSRLPQNDYYSADASPVPIIDPDNKVQVIWVGNRPSVYEPTPKAVGSECPPGNSTANIPSSSAPVNLLYAKAEYAGDVADDQLYRGYAWDAAAGLLTDAYNLSNDSAEGTVSSSPWALGDAAARWVFWHRRLQHPGGTESTLRYDTSTASDWAWTGSGAGEWIYASGLPKENLRSFIDGDGEHWLFWHTGSEGKQYLMYRWDYTLGTTDNKEGPVPVTNRAAPQWRADAFPAIDPRDTANDVGIKKPTQSPFTYTKDPSVFSDPSGNVNLFFSGYARSEGEADICWTRFDPGGMDGADSTIPNYGKLAFSRLQPADGPYVYTTSGSWVAMPEEFSANGLRQVFSSRGLDWLCHHTTEDWSFAHGYDGSLAEVDPEARNPGDINLTPGNSNYLWSNSYLDPAFCLALIYDDPSDGNRPQAQLFHVAWQKGTYYRSRGAYRVLPRLYPLTAGAPPAALVDSGSGYYLLMDPKVTELRAKGMTVPDQYVVMEIGPATGTVSFSSPLYNVDNPADPVTVFPARDAEADLMDVAVYGAYYPYVYRVTRNGADDDCPSAFYNADLDPGRLTVFWRRRYPVSSSPHFGRSGFMHKTYTTSVRVAKPSISSIASVVNAYDTGTDIPYSANNGAGIITVSEGYIGYTLQITYDSADGSSGVVEWHEVPGWSVETPVPIRTGGAEGRLVVKPEAYTVKNEQDEDVSNVRYWLFWTSLGRVYDLRLLDASSARAAGDPIIVQSADVYSAVVSPDAGPVIRERRTSSVSFDPS